MINNEDEMHCPYNNSSAETSNEGKTDNVHLILVGMNGTLNRHQGKCLLVSTVNNRLTSVARPWFHSKTLSTAESLERRQEMSECLWNNGRIMPRGENGVFSKRPVLLSVYPPQIEHRLV